MAADEPGEQHRAPFVVPGVVRLLGHLHRLEPHADGSPGYSARRHIVLPRGQLEGLRAQMAERGDDTSLIDQALAAGAK